METTAPSPIRRIVLPLVLLVPLVVDPHGIDTLALERLMLALVGLLLVAGEAGEVLVARRSVLAFSMPEVLLLALAVWSGTSMLWATNPQLSLSGVAMLLAMLGVARTVRAGVSGTATARGWIVAMLLVGLVAMGIDAVAIQQRSPELAEGAEKYASLLFVHNNMAATFGVMLAPLAAVLLLHGPGRPRRILGALALGAAVAYLLLLGSRSGLLALLISLPLVAIAFLLRGWITSLRVGGGGLAVAVTVLVLFLGVMPFSDRARGLAKDAFYRTINVLEEHGVSSLEDSGFRPDIFTKTIEMARTAPLRGVGAANWAVEYPKYERFIRDRPHAHNDALQVLSELGVPGLLLFLGLLGSLALTQLRIMSAAKAPGAFACGAGLLGTLLVFVVSGVFEVPFTIGATAAYLALVIGLTTRLGETGGHAVGTIRPGRPTTVAGLLVALAGCVYVVQRLPAPHFVHRAEEQAEAGDSEAAIESLQRVAAMGTGSYLPERQLGRLYLERGEAEKALEHFQAARRYSPHKVDLLRDVGEALIELDRNDEAVARLREAAEASPGDDRAVLDLAHALDRAGRVSEAIDLLQDQVQSRLRTVDIDIVLRLARLWRRLADERVGIEQVEALAASRHFYAVMLEDGPVSMWPEVRREFKHITHMLQVMPGSPDSWWPVYERFLESARWHMPAAALWTALDEDGVKLYPGWEQPAGPPRPRDLREQP